MKRIICALLSISLILGILAFTVSCGRVIIIDKNGGSTVQPDSSLSDDTSADSGDLPSFIENGAGEVDYSTLSPEARGILSAVRIVAHFERYIGYGQTSLSKYKKESSGVIYKLDREKGDAYIITNFHAVYHKDAISTNHVSNNIELFLYGQEDASYSIPATYIGGSLTSEIAVLKVSANEVIKHSHALAATLANSNEINVYDNVFAVGNPEGAGLSITSGIISVDHDELSVIAADGKTTLKLRAIRTSAAINEGNSGGGLFNENGELCGIVVAKKTGEEIDNIAYAIPANLAKLMAEIMIETYSGSPAVGFYKYQLGITMDPSAMGVIIVDGKLVKVERVAVATISSGSVLEGSVAVGDVINSIKVDGKTTEVTRVHNVIEAMLEARVGSTVTLSLTRGELTFEKTITVAEAHALFVQ